MTCPFCKTEAEPIAVAGHIQCSECTQVIEGCCSGESQEIEGENQPE